MHIDTTTPGSARRPRLSAAAKKTTFAALTGLTLVGTLSGCAAAEAESSATTAPSAEATSSSQPSSSTGTTGTSAAASSYTDGSYTADGSYQSPNGTESVTVTVTLADDVVTDVKVVSHAESANSKRYQSEFISGIAAEVVGKDINSLSVTKVAGSSLTSGGFNAAIETIKSEAAG